MNIISVFFDVVIILVVLLIIFISYKKGFALSVLGVIAWILALTIANAAAPITSEFAYDYVESIFLGDVDNTLDTDVSFGDIEENIKSLYEELPTITVNTMEFFGNTSEKVTENIKIKFSEATVITVRSIVDVAIKPVILSLLKSIFFLIFFIILLPLFQLLAKILSKFFKIPILSSLDKLLGGLLGLIKAIIFVVILSVALQLFITATNNQNEFMNYEILNSSYIFSLVDNYKF